MTLTLPIDAVMPEVIDALRSQGRVVLQAPPGAGKTTRVPLAMLDANLTTGRILMLEQRRLAARAAAERMAQTIGEPVGETVGYRIRGTSKVSKQTRIEVVTEGILTRMLQDQPDLPNIGAVIFDEFHERSLNADLGLALCLEVASALRDDLLLVAMSATLDAAPIAKVMDAPIVTSQGRAYDVTPIGSPNRLPKPPVLNKPLLTPPFTPLVRPRAAFLCSYPVRAKFAAFTACLKAKSKVIAPSPHSLALWILPLSVRQSPLPNMGAKLCWRQPSRKPP